MAKRKSIVTNEWNECWRKRVRDEKKEEEREKKPSSTAEMDLYVCGSMYSKLLSS